MRPKLRAARFTDIPAIVLLLQEAHAASRYAAISGLDEQAAKSILQHVIKSHGGKAEHGTFVALVDNGVMIEGLIIGQLSRVYFALDVLEATDIVFYVRPGAHAATAARLLRAMHRWARSVPGLVEIRQAATDAIEGRGEAGKLFERTGMKRCGTIYRTEVNPCQV